MRFYFSDNYVFPLPEGHPFPIEKYKEVASGVRAEKLVSPESIIDPGFVSDGDLLRVHTREYVDAFRSGHLDGPTLRKIGFPWSPQFVARSHAAVAGTIAAAEAAIAYGIAFNLAGGTHHSFPNRGEGYCVFNDVAVAVRKLQSTRDLRLAIIDLDAHQGNGTNYILGEDPQVYTFSMHVGVNFPSKKFPGTEDIPLSKGVSGTEYLPILKDRLPRLLDSFRPDLVFYVAGVDVHEDDRFGQMGLSIEDVEERDRFTIAEVRSRQIPLAIVMGGGYNKARSLTSRLHLSTARLAASFARNEI